jgi:hypothetical protein
MANNLTFKPKQVSKHILKDLPSRAYEVIVNRFGLTNDAERKTLEAIGAKYHITRERVRQIENSAMALIRKSPSYKEERVVFEELKKLIHTLGGIIRETDLLEHVSKDKLVQNHINFFMNLSESFTRHKEDDHFHTRWSVDHVIADRVHKSLKDIYDNMSDDDLVSEPDMIVRFLDGLKDISLEYKKDEIARRWLKVSKKLDKNPLGEWGKSHSSGVKTRGIKDYAYLMMRKHGSPMHFREVAKAISSTFNKTCHTATCHNELIKDKRFVLVGRGI